MSSTTEQRFVLDPEEILTLCGVRDDQVRRLEGEFDVTIVPRGNELRVRGQAAAVGKASQAIENLLALQRRGGKSRQPDRHEVRQVIRDAKQLGGSSSERTAPGSPRVNESTGQPVNAPPSPMLSPDLAIPLNRRTVAPLTAGQKRYIEAIRTHDIVFGIGPAGTGKTYLAVAFAVRALMAGEVKRIILCRPAVEAGERLGFLPGDLAAKIDPYLRPLYDAMYEMMEAPQIRAHLESGVVEVAPLAFMRGRTLNSSFVILDEAQNTTHEQMKMFLTRLGFDSRAIITGDVTQIDLPGDRESGLVKVQRILKGTEGIAFVHMEKTDVVRHDLVQRIIRAYEHSEATESGQAPGPEDR